MADFEWVPARYQCSVDKVFQTIKLGIENDVALMNSLRGNPLHLGFNTTATGGSIVAFIEGKPNSVKFNKTAKGIAAFNENDEPICEATLTLNDKGECRLRIDGQERDFWQFRKMALESLFFDTI